MKINQTMITEENKIQANDEFAAYLFHQGTNFCAYDYLGAHRVCEGGGFVFRVWAPNADAIFVVGSFNNWDHSMQMTRISDKGIWEYYDIEARAKEGDLYKFKIYSCGRELYKADPYAKCCERPPETASVLYESKHKWRDAGWQKYRKRFAEDFFSKPINIYELHLGSWKRRRRVPFIYGDSRGVIGIRKADGLYSH